MIAAAGIYFSICAAVRSGRQTGMMLPSGRRFSLEPEHEQCFVKAVQSNLILLMKKLTFAICLSVMIIAPAIFAQTSGSDTNAAAPPVKWIAGKIDFSPELNDATAKLKEKFDAGKTSETDLAENLQSITALILKYQKKGSREQLARLYLLDAHIYADGLTNTLKARAIWVQVTRDFPGTIAARGASLSLARLNAQMSADDPSVPEGLEIGQRFPGFNATDLSGNSLSPTIYRGQITMIDFWATWCPPCRAEMPNVIATYNKYHAAGFCVIGVSLDSDKNAVLNYTQAQGMGWAQYFDGLGWDNKLAKQYGVQSIPMDYLLNRHGVIIGKELRGAALSRAVAKALIED
jgi:thiol-disulfide isomerase/thioredoxin